MNGFSTAVAAIGACLALNTGEVSAIPVIELDGTDGWATYETRNGGFVGITDSQPRNGNGSLELFLPGATAKSGVLFGGATSSSPALGTLSDLINGGSLSYDFYRDGSSTVAGHLAPAIKLHLRNAGGFLSTLVWEPVYNGFPTSAPIQSNTWYSLDVTDGNFWMYKKGPFGQGTIQQYNLGLEDWGNGAQPSGISGVSGWWIFSNPYDYTLGFDSVVTGISIEAGSGWNGEFLGYIDNVQLSFGNGDSYSFNFELESIPDAAIPEPVTGMLALIGLGGLGVAGLRRRR